MAVENSKVHALLAEGWTEVTAVMSNFDSKIDSAVATGLKTGKFIASYAGWNFSGKVWWDSDEETYKCEVWVYKVPQEVVSGTLQEIMDQVSEKYGSA
jgi:hypothetical protein